MCYILVPALDLDTHDVILCNVHVFALVPTKWTELIECGNPEIIICSYVASAFAFLKKNIV